MNNKKVFNEIKLKTDSLVRAITLDFQDCSFSSTIHILLLYDKAIYNLVNSLIDRPKDSELYYSKCILYRSLIEHFFKAFTLFLLASKNMDKYSVIFLENCEKYELLKYSKKLIEFLDEKTKKELLKIVDEMPSNDDVSIDKIFFWPKLLDILNSDKIDSNLKIPSKVKSKLILDYTMLNSFVHGGITALKTNFEAKPFFFKIDYMINQSLSMFIFNRTNILILYNFDKMKSDVKDKIKYLQTQNNNLGKSNLF